MLVPLFGLRRLLELAVGDIGCWALQPLMFEHQLLALAL